MAVAPKSAADPSEERAGRRPTQLQTLPNCSTPMASPAHPPHRALMCITCLVHTPVSNVPQVPDSDFSRTSKHRPRAPNKLASATSAAQQVQAHDRREGGRGPHCLWWWWGRSRLIRGSLRRRAAPLSPPLPSSHSRPRSCPSPACPADTTTAVSGDVRLLLERWWSTANKKG